jgi:sec-independent protein translocase protein TatA
MPNLRGSEWLIIILLVVLLFGAKRLPDAARSIGRSLRIFKAETKGLVEGETADAGTPAAPTATQPAQAPAPATPTVSPGQLPAAAAPSPGATGTPDVSALQPQPDGQGSALHPQVPPSAQ